MRCLADQGRLHTASALFLKVHLGSISPPKVCPCVNKVPATLLEGCRVAGPTELVPRTVPGSLDKNAIIVVCAAGLGAGL